ncbi:MAG: signal peptide peptidase SppA, partial [Novosphingobium sp.]
FGGLDDALAAAAGLARLDKGNWHARYLGDETDAYGALFARFTSDEDSAPPGSVRDWAGLLARQQASLGMRALADAERLLGARGMQAYCLECARLPQRASTDALATERRLAWLAKIVGAIGGQ